MQLLFRSLQQATRANLKMIATQKAALEEARKSREDALKATKVRNIMVVVACNANLCCADQEQFLGLHESRIAHTIQVGGITCARYTLTTSAHFTAWCVHGAIVFRLSLIILVGYPCGDELEWRSTGNRYAVYRTLRIFVVVTSQVTTAKQSCELLLKVSISAPSCLPSMI